MSRVSARGLKFEFVEELGKKVNEEVLIYTPVLSLVKLKFKEETGLPKVQFETGRDSIFNQFTPSAIMRTKVPEATLQMLERTSLDCLDTVGSYFALKWQF